MLVLVLQLKSQVHLSHMLAVVAEDLMTLLEVVAVQVEEEMVVTQVVQVKQERLILVAVEAVADLLLL
jgi:hypothetical protein